MPTASRRIALPLPPNGQQLIDQVMLAVRQDLEQFFKTHLAYPNATFKVNWSSNFYSLPYEYSGQTAVKVEVEGEKEAQLLEKGLESEMESSSLEIGLTTGEGSPAILRPGLPTPSPSQVPTESAGRRDLNMRRGAGVEFSAGRPINQSLSAMADDSRARAEVARVLSDIPKDDTSPQLPDSPTGLDNIPVGLPSVEIEEGGNS